MLIERLVRVDVALEVHAHEGGELHEARIDAAEGAVVAEGDRRDQVLLEPRSACCWQARSPGRVDAGVDRAGHQGQARGCAGCLSCAITAVATSAATQG